MARYLFIVSRDDPALYEVLRGRFADDENVEVIVDRRTPAPGAGEARQPERRTRLEVNDELRAHGYAVVVLG